MLRKAKNLLGAAKAHADEARARVTKARARAGELVGALGAPERVASFIRGSAATATTAWDPSRGAGDEPGQAPDARDRGRDELRSAPLSPEDALRAQIQSLLDERINPQVAMHGGYINLVEVKDQRVLVTMEGGCHGCAASMLTLKAGVERTIREVFPEIVAVEDVTDHSVGANPFL